MSITVLLISLTNENFRIAKVQSIRSALTYQPFMLQPAVSLSITSRFLRRDFWLQNSQADGALKSIENKYYCKFTYTWKMRYIKFNSLVPACCLNKITLNYENGKQNLLRIPAIVNRWSGSPIIFVGHNYKRFTGNTFAD